MTRFVVGDDRSQSTLFPERLEDYLAEDNPVRRSMSLSMSLIWRGSAWRRRAGGDRKPAYHPATLLKIYIYDTQSGAVESASGAGVPAQHRIGVADRPLDAGLQDDSRFPQGQRRGHTQGLP